MAITLDDFIAKLPNQLKPWGKAYGPVFIDMAAERVHQIIAMLLAGDTDAPYREAIANMTQDELDAETIAFTAQDTQHADDNAAKVEAQRVAAKTAATIIFSIIAGMVGA